MHQIWPWLCSVGGGAGLVHLLERHVRGHDRHGAAHPQLRPHDVRHLHREHLTPRRLHDPQVGVTCLLYNPQIWVTCRLYDPQRWVTCYLHDPQGWSYLSSLWQVWALVICMILSDLSYLSSLWSSDLIY